MVSKAWFCTAAALAAVLASPVALAGAPAPARVAAAASDRLTASLDARLFPLLSALLSTPADQARARTLPGVAALLDARESARRACGADMLCQVRALGWNAADRARLADALAPLAKGPLPDDGARAQILRELAGIDTVIATYALGARPSYPEIDGAGLPADSPELARRIEVALRLAALPRAGSQQGFDRSIEFALSLLEVNGRTDAITSTRANGAALRRSKGLAWAKWRYSALIVTGIGPEVEGQPLSPMGQVHLRMAANRFLAGEAPFIILTGGHAHPRATPFAEASEMAQALIERYGIPADAILIDPFARHTTTNLRNAARMLFALGAPLQKPALIVCNESQSAMIESQAFVRRNAAELGYQPGTVGHRVSPTELEFLPARASVRIDPHDPLDP